MDKQCREQNIYGFLFIKLLWFGDKDKTIFVKIKLVQQIVFLLHE